MQKQFRKWFIAQHGQRETDLVDFTDSELADRVAAGELAQDRAGGEEGRGRRDVRRRRRNARRLPSRPATGTDGSRRGADYAHRRLRANRR